MRKKIFTFLLALAASVGMSWATTTDLASITDNYTAQDGEILTGTLGVSVKISIADKATVTLLNANINGDKTLTTGQYAGLTCLGDATITIVGTNSVSGYNADNATSGFPGIFVPSGKTLIINGTGSLTAQSSVGDAAGIGAGGGLQCGNIVIQSGKITAIAGAEDRGAGIGGAYNANCGDITISGGIVTAVGGYNCPGIGGGRRKSGSNAGHCGNILISGGVVSATSGEGAAAIGSGQGVNSSNTSNCGTITITSTALKVYADKGEGSGNTIGAGKNGTCGAVEIGGNTGVINTDPYTYRTKEDGEIVVGYIGSIGTVVYTQECKDKIDIARELYDALEASQIDLVTNYQTLLDAEDAYAALIPQPAPEIKLNADFGGPDNWADTEAFTDNGDGTASWSISTLTAGNWYHFGVKVDGTWTSDNAAFSRENPSRVVSGTGEAMWFQADVAGEYTFTWEYATNTLTIGYPEIHTYTAVGQNLAIFGNSWDPSITANDLVLQEDGSYKWEKENVSFTGAMTIQYRVCEDHAWGVAYPATSEQPASFEIPGLGDYKITITYNPVGNVISASAEKIDKPTIQLNGNFSGEWADTEAFEVVEQPMDSYAKLTKLLEPGTYEFGVKVNGEWRANGSAYTRDNTTYSIEEGHSDNLTINVDVKGYYSFFWYYDDNRLAIDYSRVCGMYWKDVTAGNFEVTLGQEGEVTLPKVWATSMAFVANIANGSDQVRLGSTDETVATIAYTLSMDGLGTLTFHQAGECDIYVVHDITNLYCYDSCAFHLTVHPAPTTAVVIGDPNNVSEVETFLSTYDGQTIDELIIDRPVLNNMYNTLCLPFDMNAAQIAASSLNGVEIREFTGASVEGTTLNLSVGDPVNAVVAGRPYFVKYSAASQLDDLHFEDVTINNALLDNMAVTFDGVTFKGTFTPFEMPNGLNFQGGYLFLGQNNQLFWPNTDNPLKPFRAYFYVDVESSTPGNAPKYRGMPARIVEGKNVATGVENAKSANQSTKVIVNGQLIIIKNDVRYNAQGQVVK